ncbi:MAG: MaoC family dehydratase N-terminal domain-containing protein [Nocardioidaceae bacterium]
MLTPEPTLDDAALAEVRSLIGVPLRRDRMQFIESATDDSIRHFAEGIADDNPLWRDPTYAAESRWGGLLAPPSILYAVDATIVAPKLAGWQWIYAGTRFTWFDVIRAGDTFDATATLVDVELKSGRRFSSWALQSGQVDYRIRGSNRLLATAIGRTARTPRQQPAPRPAPEGPPRRRDREVIDLADLVGDLTPQVRRGSRPRWAEDVAIGDAVGPLVRGPLRLDDIVRWYRGAQGALHYGGAHGDAVRYRQRHRDYETNTRTGAKDATARGHFQAEEGRAVGMEGAYDVGPQRISWAASMLTDWAGDDGFLCHLSVDVLKPNLVGHTTAWTGQVVAMDAVGNNHMAGLTIVAHNQFGDVTARGQASVALPSRAHGEVQLPLSESDAAVAARLPSELNARG